MTHQPSLTLKEVASLVQVHVDTVLSWIRRGDLIAYRAGRQWRVDPVELERFKSRHRATPAPRARDVLPRDPRPTADISTWPGARRFH